MTIDFRKVTKTPLEFSIDSNNIVFKGSLKYHDENLVLLQATIQGSLDLDCYLCSADITLPLDEEVEFLVSNGVYNGMNEDYDVVEVFKQSIDIEELLDSEIELIKSGYHSCEACKS